jgi:alpha-tubulin suppressor-like RCC1 family protein
MALQDDINNFGSSNTVVDLLILAAETANTTNNRIISVSTINDLPNLVSNTVQPGTIMFVENLNVPVLAQVNCWTGLDNRVLRIDGNITINQAFTWGLNNCGQLGDNTITNRSSPVSVVGGFTDWCQVTSSNRTSHGIRSNGTLWGWGYRSGAAGNYRRSSPVSVVGGFTDWCQVSGGFRSFGAIRNNNTLWIWGDSTYVTNVRNAFNLLSPAEIIGGFTDWCQVSITQSDSGGAAIRTNGTAWSWGGRSISGWGDYQPKSSPVSIVGNFTDWCQVSAGSDHSVGVRANGTAWSWGLGSFGRLGTNNTINRSSPVSVLGGFTDWCQVSAGSSFASGLRANGTLWTWGFNGNGSLGDGTTTNRSSPVSVLGGFTDWCQVSTSGHTVGLRTNGTLWAWGFNGSGNLGDDTIENRSSPVLVVGGISSWTKIDKNIAIANIQI